MRRGFLISGTAACLVAGSAVAELTFLDRERDS